MNTDILIEQAARAFVATSATVYAALAGVLIERHDANWWNLTEAEERACAAELERGLTTHTQERG